MEDFIIISFYGKQGRNYSICATSSFYFWKNAAAPELKHKSFSHKIFFFASSS